MSVECIDTKRRPVSLLPAWRVWLGAGAFDRIWNAPRLWLDRARMRRELAELDPMIMRDAGLSAIDVVREAEKPFWRD
jgi:uncharacterized protein YjiS (DUF1127 family)